METIVAHRLLGCLLALCVDGISAAQEEGAETEIDFVTTTCLEDHIQRSQPDVLDFSKGSWTFQTYGSAAFGDPGKGEMYTGHFGVGYYFQDDRSVNLELFGAAIRSGIDDDGVALGADLLYRSHFLKDDAANWSVYLDTGAGLQQASTNFSGERHFNFRLMFGFGGTHKVSDKLHLIGSARYLHISDAGIDGGGGGFDGLMLYTGFAIPF
jgi:hypothetical protein